MATATARSALDKEAAAAAAEAAREARAEALERAAKYGGEPKRPKAPAKEGWHDFVVDVWITPFNNIEFGFWKRQRNKGKSRQFTSDMDIFAEVIENGERTGVMGYRKDLWTDNDGTDKRLVFKLFSDTLNWHATMDMMVGKSLQQTIAGRGFPVSVYSVNTNDDAYIIYLERSANKWPLMPENFGFFLMHDGQPEFYRLRRDFINLGGDYTLLDQKNEVVGWLDGRVFSIGGYWKGSVKKHHAEKRLLAVLKLFAGMLIFNGDSRRHLKRLYREVKAGRINPKLDRQEVELYANPRRVR